MDRDGLTSMVLACQEALAEGAAGSVDAVLAAATNGSREGIAREVARLAAHAVGADPATRAALHAQALPVLTASLEGMRALVTAHPDRIPGLGLEFVSAFDEALVALQAGNVAELKRVYMNTLLPLVGPMAPLLRDVIAVIIGAEGVDDAFGEHVGASFHTAVANGVAARGGAAAVDDAQTMAAVVADALCDG
jgi:hypothetical protein